MGRDINKMISYFILSFYFLVISVYQPVLLKVLAQSSDLFENYIV